MDDIPVRVISLDETKFNVAKKKIQNAGNFNDIEQWNAVRGKDFFDSNMTLYANYHDILKKKYPQVLLPKNIPLLSVAAEKAVRYGHKTTIYDLHNAGAIGCALSHISLWQYMVKNNIPAMLIFEDDVDFAIDNFSKRLQNVLKNYSEPFDVFNFNAVTVPYPLNDHTTLIDTSIDGIVQIQGVAYRTQGYFITNAGARKLLQNAFPLVYVVDVYMTTHSILPSTNVAYIATKEPWLNHPLIELVNSSVGYSPMQCLTDSVFFIPNTLLLLTIVACLLIVVILLVCACLHIYSNFAKQKVDEKQLMIQEISK